MPDLSFLARPIHAWLPTRDYPGYLEALPDLIVGRLPDTLARGRALGPWKVWIVESLMERRVWDAAMARPIPRKGAAIDFTAGPDGAVSRPSLATEVFIALYPPPEAGWPCITLGAWPASMAAPLGGLARGRYSVDADMTEADATARHARLRSLAPDAAVLLPPPRS